MTFEPSDYLAMIAIIVSIVALPFSYIVSTKQVKVGLDEHDRMARNRTRLIVVNRLNELQSLFFSAAKAFADYDHGDDTAKLFAKLEKIETHVLHTGILARLAKSIDDYEESGDYVLLEQKLMTRIQMIRGLIDQQSWNASTPTVYKILDICQGNELQGILRTVK
jgi:hypothetical protein